MAWFRNRYICARCDSLWSDEWSCMCDDDCRRCGARHMTPFASEDLTIVIELENEEFIVRWSPETAEHHPDYKELGRFSTKDKALAFIAADSC